MAAALAGHRKAAELFEPGSGRPEQSAFWPDDEFGVWRRCRLDWLRHEPGADDIVRVVDYKTCQSASREAAARSMANYGYHIQAWFNCEAVRYFRPGTDVRFTMVCQETEPPYLVECYEPDADALAEGQYWGQAAMEIFRDCLETGQWPGYNPEQTITSLALPRWGYRDDPW
jgi:hypothetical protein